FFKVIAFLMFGDDSDLGLDPNVKIDSTTGRVKQITLANKIFLVVKLIYNLDSLVGCGTKVWVMKESNESYVLKDSWIQLRHAQSEASILVLMHGHDTIKGCVPLMQINGQRDCTENYQKDLCGWTFLQRVHRHYATSPIGKPLASFKSKKEFITVMISLIQSKLSSLRCASNEAYSNSIAHQYLVKKLGILHCDISINNLLINCTNAIICGLLINFDFAILLSAANAPVVQTSTSTLGDIAVGTMYEASGTNSNVGDVERIVDMSNDEDDQGFKTSNSKVKNVRTVCSFISKSMNQRVNYKSGHTTIHGS
ncbi:hypothetical protein L208DRAFT_1239708, partial [Tricholoma matsutake]